MSVMRRVNYLPYHKVHLWCTVINMRLDECFQNWTSLLLSLFHPSLHPFFRANNRKTTFLKCNPPVDVLETFPLPSPRPPLLLHLLLLLLSSGKSAYCIIMWDDLKMFGSHKVIRKFHELVRLRLKRWCTTSTYIDCPSRSPSLSRPLSSSSSKSCF